MARKTAEATHGEHESALQDDREKLTPQQQAEKAYETADRAYQTALGVCAMADAKRNVAELKLQQARAKLTKFAPAG